MSWPAITSLKGVIGMQRSWRTKRVDGPSEICYSWGGMEKNCWKWRVNKKYDDWFEMGCIKVLHLFLLCCVCSTIKCSAYYISFQKRLELPNASFLMNLSPVLLKNYPSPVILFPPLRKKGHRAFMKLLQYSHHL